MTDANTLSSDAASSGSLRNAVDPHAVPALPSAPEPAKINIVVGNHASPHGIAEILYTLDTFFRRYNDSHGVSVGFDLVPNGVNVLIDEFSLTGSPSQYRQFKIDYPSTKLVIVATEFPTDVVVFGKRFGQTFNHFSNWEDRKAAAGFLLYRMSVKKSPPYMHRRYLGFSHMMPLADLVLTVHPTITSTLVQLGEERGIEHWASAPVTLYPEIAVDAIARDRRLQTLPPGFVMTGSLTHFRQEVAETLLRSAARAGIDSQIYRYQPFDNRQVFRLKNRRLRFDFRGRGPSAARWDVKEGNFLYNLNPPQRINWPYSSPMRMLRAILLGQIPVVTSRFHDHEIEDVARLWDLRVDSFSDLWFQATIGRKALIEQHVAAVAEYNEIARERNGAVIRALEPLLSAPPAPSLAPPDREQADAVRSAGAQAGASPPWSTNS